MVKDEWVDEIRNYSRIFVREMGLLKDKLNDLGLGYREGHILLLLGEGESLSGKEIALSLQVDKSLVSRMITRLNRAGFTEYRGEGEDRRRKPIGLTAKGREKVTEINRFASDQVQNALKDLEEEQITIIRQGFKIYSRALRSDRIEKDLQFRELSRGDSPAMEKIILRISREFSTLGAGGPSSDFAEKPLYTLYSGKDSFYLAVKYGNNILGGAGIAPLKGGEEGVCELQKMYLLKDYRGLGVGEALIRACLERAKELGYKRCYLETIERMDRARQLYGKMGFAELEGALGETGHHQSEYWMIKEL
ncbi:MAG: helix-turn-helix domain-containing GNAT family N-acetyltransferase [Spirochaetales bacterium]|nr:helix-turn-helix domain-containing GNAT family N-acetyltransferase [Spirochaetales bacterium]